MKRQWNLIIMLLVVILVVVFALQNTSSIDIKLFSLQYKISTVLLIFISILVGVFLGLVNSISSYYEYRKLSKNFSKEVEKEKKPLTDKISQLEADIQSLQQKLAKFANTESDNSATSNSMTTSLTDTTSE